MRPLLFLYLLLLFASCSRQPVRVGADPGVLPPVPTESEPNTPVDPTPDRAPETEATRPRAASADGPIRDTTDVPAEDGIGANPTPELNLPRPATETNETAEIERQGSLGEAPLGGQPKPLVPGANTEMQLTTGSCFGVCDVYTLQLNEDGRATLQVVNGLQGPGTYQLELNEAALDRLRNRMEALSELDLALQYPTDPEAELPVDAQVTTVTVPDAAGELRTITVYYDAPPALDRFIQEVQAFVEDAARRQNTSDR